MKNIGLSFSVHFINCSFINVYRINILLTAFFLSLGIIRVESNTHNIISIPFATDKIRKRGKSYELNKFTNKAFLFSKQKFLVSKSSIVKNVLKLSIDHIQKLWNQKAR